MLHIAGINYESIADSKGVSCVIFFSGCKHHCRGCHSKDTWDFNYGVPVSNELINTINKEIDKRPFLSSLVLSGGDPMYSSVEVLNFISKIHVPKNTIWCYSGFRIEEILSNDVMNELLKCCDVLVDGEYIEEQRDITLKWRGSKNQRVINIPETLKQNKVVSYCE